MAVATLPTYNKGNARADDPFKKWGVLDSTNKVTATVAQTVQLVRFIDGTNTKYDKWQVGQSETVFNFFKVGARLLEPHLQQADAGKSNEIKWAGSAHLAAASACFIATALLF